MSKQTWVHWVLAAILVVVVGALIVSAEERIEVRVEKNSADEISVDVNGVTEVVRLEDLADGGSRSFDVGDHQLVVKRVGDDLTIVDDGHPFGGPGASPDTMVWIGDDGEEIKIGGDGEQQAVKKIIVMASGDQAAGEARTYTIRVDGDDVLIDGEHNAEIDEIMQLDGGHHGAVFFSDAGGADHPVIVKGPGMHAGMVKYVCQETGSILLVKKEDAVQDTYICPATGCVMTKVDEPEVRVIRIEKKVEIDE